MKRVLVCEDDRGIRAFLDRFMSRAGYTVDVAADGRDCMEKMEQNEYDAVLLDLMMPNIDGYEVLDFLRQTRPDTLGRTLIISASSRAFKDPPDGVAGFFSKPFDLGALQDRLAAVLQRPTAES